MSGVAAVRVEGILPNVVNEPPAWDPPVRVAESAKAISRRRGRRRWSRRRRRGSAGGWVARAAGSTATRISIITHPAQPCLGGQGIVASNKVTIHKLEYGFGTSCLAVTQPWCQWDGDGSKAACLIAWTALNNLHYDERCGKLRSTPGVATVSGVLGQLLVYRTTKLNARAPHPWAEEQWPT